MDLGIKPRLQPGTELLPGIRLARLWVIGNETTPPEVGELQADRPLTDGELRRCWQRRLQGRPIPLWLFARTADGIGICGPDEPPAVVHLPEPSAVAVLRHLVTLPPNEAVRGYLALVARSQGTAGVPGLRNRQLLSTYYLTRRLPARDPAAWKRWREAALNLRGTSGRLLFERLGFEVESAGPSELVLKVTGHPVAVAHLYRADVALDRMLPNAGGGRGVPPAALVLEAARTRGVRYAFLAAGSVLRLHRTVPGEGFEETAATGAYIELDLSLLPDEYIPLVWAVCSAEALGPNGHINQLFDEARRYAVELRDRFRDRVYTEVVPTLVRGLWNAAREYRLNYTDPQVFFRATLLLLFRILFVLYAEDRNLLPVRHPVYWQRSLTRRVEDILRTHKRDPEAFEPRHTDIWDDLVHIFAAIRDGHKEWGIPPYDGGLFEDDASDEARLLAHIRLSNQVMGPALHRLAIDRVGDEEGKVDFGDLGVRHLGAIYEGLLSFRAVVATVDLTVNRRERGQTYVPAKPGDPVEVRAGEVYLVSPQGGRKATGSYYTPSFVVNRLVEDAIEPVLEAHFRRLDELDEAAASAAFFDIKVCDPAMGSGHFLTRALDFIADRLQSYLAKRPLPAVAAELERARERIRAVGQEYGVPDLGESVGDFDLLRRLVLKRCIYGVDLNPMAVELARLSLWLRAFVPGLPLSYLGHTLRCGNSLVGVAGPELVDSLYKNVFGEKVKKVMQEAVQETQALGRLDDVELHEVQRSYELQQRIEERTRMVRLIYDAYTGQGFDSELQWSDFLFEIGTQTDEEWHLPPKWEKAATRARNKWNAFHWPLAFPEVFFRERPGFDVVIGNPPWEEVTVEELGFFARYIPGLKGERSSSAQQRRIAEFVKQHPDVYQEYQVECQKAAELRAYLGRTYELTRSGDPDLYRAFCERFLQILRPGGYLGVVLPRTAFSGDGTAPFRARLFQESTRVRLDFLRNAGGWVFPDAEHRYTLVLTLASYTGGDLPEAQMPHVISVAGPAESFEEFERLDAERIEWTLEELRKASDGLEVPLIPDRRAAALYRRLLATHPRFDAEEGGFRVVPWAELHATHDRKKTGLLRESGRGWPVYTGESFDLWNPNHTPPVQVIPPEEGLVALQRKRQRSPVWRAHFPQHVLADPSTLPQHRARILFRDVARNDDSRTVRACLVPPRVFATNKAPTLLFPVGDTADMLYVLGMMCSVPFDWLARRRVETNLNFYILNALPLPRPPRNSILRRRIVEVAGRLACPDERFREVAEAVGVEWGPLPPAEKADLIAELDALGAHAYGLTEEELHLVFEDFPETEAGVSRARRKAIIEHYRSWRERLS